MHSGATWLKRQKESLIGRKTGSDVEMMEDLEII